MALDPQYVDAIKGFEGYSPNASWDYKQNSSGYGTKAQPGDENIPPDQLQAIHEQRFQDEITKAAAHVDSVNPDLPPGAKAALISLTYNAGPGWSKSGLGDLVRKGDLEGAQAKILEYNKAGGEVNPGLVARRQKEAAWFTAPDQNAPASPASPPSASPVAPMPLGLAPAATPGMPLSLAPPNPPIFAQQPQAPQMQAGSPGMANAAFNQIPAQPAMQPIFIPPRKPVDLSRLRAQLASNAPIFPKQG